MSPMPSSRLAGLLAAASVLALAGAAHARPIINEEGSNYSQNLTGPFSVAVIHRVPAGELVVVGVSVSNGESGPGAVTDDEGNTYTLDSSVDTTNFTGGSRIYHSILTTELRAGDDVTYTPTGSPGPAFNTMDVVSMANMVPSDIVDCATGQYQGTADTTYHSGTCTPSVVNDVAFGWVYSSHTAGALTNTGGFAVPPAPVQNYFLVGGGTYIDPNTDDVEYAPTAASGQYTSQIVLYKSLVVIPPRTDRPLFHAGQANAGNIPECSAPIPACQAGFTQLTYQIGEGEWDTSHVDMGMTFAPGFLLYPYNYFGEPPTTANVNLSGDHADIGQNTWVNSFGATLTSAAEIGTPPYFRGIAFGGGELIDVYATSTNDGGYSSSASIANAPLLTLGGTIDGDFTTGYILEGPQGENVLCGGTTHVTITGLASGTPNTPGATYNLSCNPGTWTNLVITAVSQAVFNGNWPAIWSNTIEGFLPPSFTDACATATGSPAGCWLTTPATFTGAIDGSGVLTVSGLTGTIYLHNGANFGSDYCLIQSQLTGTAGGEGTYQVGPQNGVGGPGGGTCKNVPSQAMTSAGWAHYQELDINENFQHHFGDFGNAIGASNHEWCGGSAIGVPNAVPGATNANPVICSSSTTQTSTANVILDGVTYHHYQLLVIPASSLTKGDGSITYYIDGVQIGNANHCVFQDGVTTIPTSGCPIYGVTDKQHIFFILGAGNPLPNQLHVKSIQVWQAPGGLANDIVN